MKYAIAFSLGLLCACFGDESVEPCTPAHPKYHLDTIAVYPLLVVVPYCGDVPPVR